MDIFFFYIGRGVKGSKWRISYVHIERDTLLQAGETVRKVFQALKLFVALHHNAKDDEKPEIPRKSSISSYALKTCLFFYLRSNPPPWAQEDIVYHCSLVKI